MREHLELYGRIKGFAGAGLEAIVRGKLVSTYMNTLSCSIIIRVQYSIFINVLYLYLFVFICMFLYVFVYICIFRCNWI